MTDKKFEKTYKDGEAVIMVPEGVHCYINYFGEDKEAIEVYFDRYEEHMWSEEFVWIDKNFTKFLMALTNECAPIVKKYQVHLPELGWLVKCSYGVSLRQSLVTHKQWEESQFTEDEIKNIDENYLFFAKVI